MCGEKEQNLLQILLEEAFISSLLGSQRKQKKDNGRQWKKEDDERERKFRTQEKVVQWEREAAFEAHEEDRSQLGTA